MLDQTKIAVTSLLASLLMTSCLGANVEITSPSQAVTVTRGSSLVIVCNVTDLSKYDIASGELIWGRIIASLDELTSDGKNYIITNVTHSQYVTSWLNIVSLRYEDEARYYCTWRQVTQRTDYLIVKVTGPPEIVNLTFDGNPVAGQNLMIMCTVEGNPLPVVRWSGAALRSVQSSLRHNVSVIVVSRYTKISSLQLYNITTQHLGSYYCKTENTNGSDIHDIELNLQLWISISTSSRTDRNPTTDPIVTSVQPVTLYCDGYNAPSDVNVNVLWYFKAEGSRSFQSLANNTRMEIVRYPDLPLTEDYDYNDDNDYYYYSFRSQLFFTTHFSDQGTVRCLTLQNGSRLSQIDRQLDVQDLPHITMTPDRVGVSIGDVIFVTCTIESRPSTTNRYWIKNYVTRLSSKGQRINDYTEELTFRLEISSTVDIFNVYTCVANNSYGRASLDLKIQEHNSCSNDVCSGDNEYCVDTGSSYLCLCQDGYYRDAPSGLCVSYPTSTTYLTTSTTKRTTTTVTTTSEGNAEGQGSNTGLYAGIGAGVAVVIIVVVIVLCVVVNRRRRQGTGGGSSAGIRKPPEGNVRELPPSPALTPPTTTSTTYYSNAAFSPFSDPHEYTPLTIDRSEFPRDRLQLLEKLGQGKFGMVVRALALGLLNKGKWDTVAVKMHGEAATDAEKSEFLKELSLLRSLPRHPNVVSFVGCCTLADPTLIIMEYCPHGDLLSYLRKRRPDRGQLPDKAASDLTARDFFSFALHVARGMAHIADNKIVHRDVAARNVLISDRNLCKVSDLGLARRVGDNSDVYEIVSRRPLPLRWMSPESLRDGIHTSQSDVWSYGILLWELVTLGASPYPGNTGKAVINLVTSGTRPEIPPQCRGELADLMSSCWAMVPEKRPTFDAIAHRFERLLEQEGDYLLLDNMNEGIYSVLETSASGERV